MYYEKILEIFFRIIRGVKIRMRRERKDLKCERILDSVGSLVLCCWKELQSSGPKVLEAVSGKSKLGTNTGHRFGILSAR